MQSRLLLLACSQKKRSESGYLPAIERYDGPAFRVLRKYLRENNNALDLNIYIISARYGLLAANQEIPDYDQALTETQIDSLSIRIEKKLSEIIHHLSFDESFISGGKLYINTLGKYKKFFQEHKNTTISSGAPGQRVSELKKWLYRGNLPEYGEKKTIVNKVTRLNGTQFLYTYAQAIEIAKQGLEHHPQGSKNYHSWYVVVDGEPIAPKWLVSQITKLPVSEFHTDSANRILMQIGFEIHSKQ